MKRIQRFYSLLLLLVMFGLPALHAQSYNKLWKQVEEAQKKSLPQTVIKLTDEIYRKGEREKNAPQMLKAYICREAHQKQLTPDSVYSSLKTMERWALTEKDPVNQAILHSLLAHAYADFMQSNRRVLLERTLLDADEAPDDLREWSLNQFVSKIDRHNRASLQDIDRLLEVSATKYVPFTELEEGSRFYQHDMYHLMATRAIAAYRTLQGFDVDSLMRQRIKDTYEQMIHIYRQRTGAEDAALLCTLDYWAWKRTAGKVYLQALDDLIKEFGERDICAEVYIKKASYLCSSSEDGSVAKALKVCEEGLKRYSSYKRVNQLKNIREQILQPQLRVTTRESGYPGDSVDLSIRFRNLQGFTLNLYATTLTERPWLEKGISEEIYKKYARKVSSTHFNLKPLPGEGKLPEDIPYLSTDTVFKIQIPKDPGLYILQVMPDGKSTGEEARFLASTCFKVMKLDLGDGRAEFVALDARSGQPISEAKLSFYSASYKKDRKLLAEVMTNAEGKAILSWQEEVRSYVARKGTDTAMPLQSVYLNRSYRGGTQDLAVEEELTLLTDRSVYRPGQTVYVKGIAYRQNEDSASVFENAECELTLLDVNDKKLASKKVKTNDFGSFTAEFMLPSACLNGRFSISADDWDAVAYFQVEEYKRPTFEVSFVPVSEAYKLGDKITLRGNVKAYNGMALQDVPLAYKVTVRNVLLGFRGNSEKPLLADTLQLDANGDFAIPLKLEAPETTLDKYRTVLTYQVEAVVTDGAGETQTASYTLTAGDKAYSFDADLPAFICKEDSLLFTFEVRNTMNLPLSVQGTYRLYPVAEDEKGHVHFRKEKAVAQGVFAANRRQDFSDWSNLPSGNYRLELSVRDSLGYEENNELYRGQTFVLFSKRDVRPATPVDLFYYGENVEFNTEQPAVLFLGSSHQDAYILMDVFCNRKRIESRVLQLSDTITHMEYPYKEAYGDGVTLLFYLVKNGEVFSQRVFLKKKKTLPRLNMKWVVFRDRLLPGQEEEWKLVIKRPEGMSAAAEMLATMYDASLDQIYKQNQTLEVLYPNRLYNAFRNVSSYHTHSFSFYFPLKSWKVPVWSLDRFYSPQEELAGYIGSRGIRIRGYANAVGEWLAGKVSGVSVNKKAEVAYPLIEQDSSEAFDDVIALEEVVKVGQPLQPVKDLRTNFSETAFFYPQLRTNAQGEIAFSFTMPQSLTRWNFHGYAHTKDMLTGQLDATAVTAKEFMLTPNMPRFVRVGDETQIAGKLANLTERAVKGTVTFTLFDPMTEKVLSVQKQKFTVEAGRSTTVQFGFEATERYDLLGVRMVADGGTFSDGEQHLLPVLSNKEYITETLAMPVRGKETRTFSLDSLFNRNASTATNRRLTVEFTGNPAWYAVQALPTLSLPSTDNAISWAVACYANSLAGYIVNSQPRIKAIFESWRRGGGTKETLLSNLEKNQEVKNILLGESPWLLEATTEAEQKARIATLFEMNQLNARKLSAFTKLKELQTENGAWNWYKGMSTSRFITGYITGLLVRLPLLTKEELPSDLADMKQKAFGYLHKEALAEYYRIRKEEKKGAKVSGLSEAVMNYLYLIALSGEKVPEANKTAYRYFLSQVGELLEKGGMSRKAQAAVILEEAGRKEEAQSFRASIKEHLVQTDEQGAYFAFHAHPYAWGMLPVPAHVAVMEALSRSGADDALVEEMKLWLLKQKQTTVWDSPVATADAVYALLCRGGNLLENRGEVRISIGKEVMSTTASEQGGVPGLSYVKETFAQGHPALKAKTVTVEKRDEGIAWGAVYAQYLSPVSEVKQHGGELNVEKKLYVERLSADGTRTLQPIVDTSKLLVGDNVVSRLTIRLDRAMDFVQLKDRSGACLEPTGALSGYRWNNGFGYYVEVEDAGTNFFFDHLGKGVYVLEHSYRIARQGKYQTGLATIQCAYAPEYASHSSGATLHIE